MEQLNKARSDEFVMEKSKKPILIGINGIILNCSNGENIIGVISLKKSIPVTGIQ